MIIEMLNQIQNYLNLFNISKNIDMQNIYVVTKYQFYAREKIYLEDDFIAGYTFYNNKDYIIITKKMPSGPFAKSILFHECIHLFSNKVINNKKRVGITFPKEKFVGLNEGANELVSGYLFQRLYESNYAYCKPYKVNRIICQHIIDTIYKCNMEFIESYFVENPYEFYKKIFYHFKVNNLLELKKILDNIYNIIVSNKNMDIYEINDVIDMYLVKR